MVMAWAAVILVLAVSFAFFLRFAWGAIAFPFGMDYAEGEIWRQANAIAGGSLYGDINAYPWIAFEYPPLFYVVVNGMAHFTATFLQAGRSLATISALLCAVFVARLVFQGARYGAAWLTAALAATVAGLTIFTLVPVIAFATLVHVDTFAIMLSLAGMVMAAAALARPALLYPAVLTFVAAVFVKQSCIAAPAAVLLIWGLRDIGLTARAYGLGGAVGLMVTAWLSWLTSGGFLRHIFTYNINIWRLHNLLVLTGNVVKDCGMLIELTVVAVALHWAVMAGRLHLAGWRDVRGRLRSESETAFFCLMTAYLLLCAMSTMLAGKNGASVNYFVETLCAGCIWLGFLVVLHIGAAGALRLRPRWQQVAFTLILPAVLIWQVVPMPQTFLANMTALYGPAIRQRDLALLAAVQRIDKPILSDDIALLLVAGKQAPIEPFIFAELSAAGLWDEGKLVAMLRDHQIGAVITYRDPGDPTFDVRFRPRTAAAILQNYPRVVDFGESRLRLPP
jgi:hypothetical protein